MTSTHNSGLTATLPTNAKTMRMTSRMTIRSMPITLTPESRFRNDHAARAVLGDRDAQPGGGHSGLRGVVLDEVRRRDRGFDASADRPSGRDQLGPTQVGSGAGGGAGSLAQPPTNSKRTGSGWTGLLSFAFAWLRARRGCRARSRSGRVASASTNAAHAPASDEGEAIGAGAGSRSLPYGLGGRARRLATRAAPNRPYSRCQSGGGDSQVSKSSGSTAESGRSLSMKTAITSPHRVDAVDRINQVRRGHRPR